MAIQRQNNHYSLYLIIRMKRIVDHNNSTQRILKSKYLDKDKQKTISLISRSNNNIKLVDLCPEEKLKIGELIKTLQARKIENIRITDQNYQLTQKYQQCQTSIDSLRKELQLMEEQFTSINLKNQQNDIKIRQQEMYIASLKQQLDKCNQIILQKSSKELSSVQTQTQDIGLTDVAIQVKKRKHKNKNYQVHIQTAQPDRNLFYRPHSKSFDKIMKGPLPLDSYITTSYKERTISQKHTNKIGTESRQNQKSSPEVNNFSSQPEQNVQSLAERWKKIKQNSRRQLKNQAAFFSKQPFKHHSHVLQESDQDDQEHPSYPSKIGTTSNIEDYDEKQLNKLLKLKNFSANKLLKANLNSSLKRESSNKQSPQISYLKSPYFNDNLRQFSGQSKVKTHFQHQTSTDGNINFFESDILELAQKINL